MITKVTSENREAFTKRLQDISKALKANGKNYSVNSLEEYYAHIVDIAELATTKNAPYKYFLMPLDEPMFEIDANTRKIAVPQHFAKNGVGVHGDHMAEVLYFRIDRYFDYQDLYNVSDIVINWQFRPNNASRNSSVATHTAYALAPDETFDPGHVVFGWVIGNYIKEIDEEGNPVIAHMTPSRGTLTFSVSFIKKNADNEFEYVFNTQTASVNIYDSLAIEDGASLDPVNIPMFRQLVNSSYTPEGMNPLIAPMFYSGKEATDKNKIKRYSGLNDTANFEFNADKTGEETKLTLTAKAGVLDDASGISYLWEGTDYDGNKLGEDGKGITKINASDLTYIKTADAEYQSGKFYFIAEDGAYKALEDAEAFAEALEDKIDIYELGSEISVTKGGNYMVTISSYKYDPADGESIITYSPQTQSNVCFVPKAAVPAVEIYVENSEQESALFDTDSAKFDNGLFRLDEKDREDQVEEDGELVLLPYQYYDQEDESSAPPAIRAKVSIDKGKIEKRTYDANGKETIVGVEGVTNESTLGFVKLYLTNNGTAPEASEYSKVANRGEFIENSQSADLQVPNASGAGHWQVYAVNERNHTYSLSDVSNKIYVSQVAPSVKMNLEARTVSYTADQQEQESATKIDVLKSNVSQLEEDGSVQKRSSNQLRFYATIDDAQLQEKFEGCEISVEAVEIDAEGKPLYESPKSPRETDTEDVYELLPVENRPGTYSFMLDEGGLFRLRITSIYHGTKRVTLSDAFSVSST